MGADDYIAGFEYDDNGNRSKLTYYLDGASEGNSVSISYTYNLDNLLTGYSTSSYGDVNCPTFTLNDVNVDGLGRLKDANETITKTDQSTLDHLCAYSYDMLSCLIDANITNAGGYSWIRYAYSYDKAGNMISYLRDSSTGTDRQRDYGYNGDQLTHSTEGMSATWDLNGRQTSRLAGSPSSFTHEYDWDGRLRKSLFLANYIEPRYTPEGVRIAKKKTWATLSYDHKYVVDIVGDYPTVLLTLDAADNDAVLKTYIHANGQVLAQHDGDYDAQRYFYLHDRLGSVRAVIDANAEVKNCYFYDPWGLQEGTSENQEGADNFYRFAGYMIDLEAGQYYCNARRYDYYIGRFTSRDPVRGSFTEPMTLHPYLYCLNDPINNIDPEGEIIFSLLYYAWGRTLTDATRHRYNRWVCRNYIFAVTAVLDIATAATTVALTYRVLFPHLEESEFDESRWDDPNRTDEVFYYIQGEEPPSWRRSDDSDY